ncbi:uncharacterized protein FTOL_10559 [Fusarium torulosum]|uniref:Uncharacterized protein n=1 Tax=Fusarium torulosum TaxID=33205 RepID=A0AAE8MI46_9HYPO|nr:uncharacterized protein FTOL_10559 [Fusarium torulosum]
MAWLAFVFWGWNILIWLKPYFGFVVKRATFTQAVWKPNCNAVVRRRNFAEDIRLGLVDVNPLAGFVLQTNSTEQEN